MRIEEFLKLTMEDTAKLMNLDLTKIDCQTIFLYMTQIPLKEYHKKLVNKIMEIVPIFSYEVKMLMDEDYLKLFTYTKEPVKRKLLDPVFDERKKKKRNNEKKKIRRMNKEEAKIKAEKIIADKKEYKLKIENIYKKINGKK